MTIPEIESMTENYLEFPVANLNHADGRQKRNLVAHFRRQN
jgi:hypothetical protein